MEKIVYSGLDQISSEEKVILDKLSSEYFEKIQNLDHKDVSIHVHIKKHSKNGSKPKWSIHVQVLSPSLKFTSDKAHDYDFARTLHKSFKDIEQEIIKKIKNEHKVKTKKPKLLSF